MSNLAGKEFVRELGTIRIRTYLVAKEFVRGRGMPLPNSESTR